MASCCSRFHRSRWGLGSDGTPGNPGHDQLPWRCWDLADWFNAPPDQSCARGTSGDSLRAAPVRPENRSDLFSRLGDVARSELRGGFEGGTAALPWGKRSAGGEVIRRSGVQQPGEGLQQAGVGLGDRRIKDRRLGRRWRTARRRSSCLLARAFAPGRSQRAPCPSRRRAPTPSRSSCSGSRSVRRLRTGWSADGSSFPARISGSIRSSTVRIPSAMGAATSAIASRPAPERCL